MKPVIKKKKPDSLLRLSFENAQAWRRWLTKNYLKQEGIWLRLFKKHSGIKTINHAEALDEALCFGWIDGQGKSGDETSWLIKFTPRRIKSIWSKRNKEIVARLIMENRMTKHGLQAIQAAKADGRWDAAYDSPKNMRVPEDFLQLLKSNKKAEMFYKSLNKANTYAIAWRLQTAKSFDMRKRRMQKIFRMLQDEKKFH